MDWPRVKARKDTIVAGTVSGILHSLQQNHRIDIIKGWARFSGPRKLEAADGVIEADRVIIASGVAPNIPEIPGLEAAGFLTNETAMDQDELPRA